MSKLTFSRNASGDFDLGEAKLATLNAALFERAAEPRLPVTLMSAASRELISAVHRTADSRRITFAQAASVVVRERPQLFKLTRCANTHDDAGDVDISE